MNVTEHIDTAKIVNLPMGSSIPEWLLVAEPLQAGAPKGNWRFDCDVCIVELSADFFVMPIIPLGVASTCSVFDFNGMLYHTVDAASKPVRVIQQVVHFFPVEYREAVRALRPNTPPQVVISPAPPVGIVRRWWRALFG